MEILYPVIIVSVIGLIAGVVLTVASKLFFVEGDERAEKIRECLPGANCGGCGYSGCEGFANALAAGETEASRCAVASAETIGQIAEILGVEVSLDERKVAYLKCSGDCTKTSVRFDYEGIKSCAAAALVHGGNTACEFGCLGLGDCASACVFGGVTIENGLPRFNKQSCVGCGTCIAVCPRGIIALSPVSKTHHVGCSSTLKGAALRKVCTAGCIGCGKCAKNCPEDAISIQNNLAFINPDKCSNCGKCVEGCPTKCIS